MAKVMKNRYNKGEKITTEMTIAFEIFYFYLFLEKAGRNRGREASKCGCLSHASNWGPGLQPRHVP